MRPRQALAGLGDPEIAIFGIGAQTIGFEILVPVVADGDALFWTHAFCQRHAARFRVSLFAFWPRLFFAQWVWRCLCAQTIFSAPRRGPQPAMSASAWPWAFSLR